MLGAMRPGTGAEATLHYRQHGDAGPAVVLLHGLGSSSADWPEQQAALAPAHRVLALDLPGHGASPLPSGRLTVEGMAAAVAALLERLDEAPAHVVGLSLGACVALRLALGAPSRVRSLTLINPFARLRPGGPGHVARLGLRLVLLGSAPMRTLATHVARGLFPWPERSVRVTPTR
jgi:3-oxoadipate enol-lactonase